MTEESIQPCPQCGGIHEPGNCKEGRQQEPVNQYGGTPEDPLNIADFTHDELTFGFGLSNMISVHEFDRVKAVMERHNLQNSMVRENVKDALRRVVNNGTFDFAMEVIAEFDLPEDDVRAVIKEVFLIKIKKSSVEEIKKMLEKFAVIDELILDRDVQNAIKAVLKFMIRDFKTGSGADIAEFIGLLDPKGSITELPEVRTVVIETVGNCLDWGEIRRNDVDILIREFDLSEDDLKDFYIKNLISNIENGAVLDDMKRYVYHFHLSDLVIKSPELQMAVAKALFFKFENVYWLDDADTLIELFNPPVEVIKDAVLSAFKKILLEDVDIGQAKRFLERYSKYLPKENYVPEVEKLYLQIVEGSLAQDILGRLKEIFSLEDSFTSSERVLSAALGKIKQVFVNGSRPDFLSRVGGYFGFNEDDIFNSFKKDKPFSTFIEKFSVNDLSSLEKYFEKYRDYFIWLVKYEKDWGLESEDLEFLAKSRFDYKEGHVLKECGLDLNSVINENT